MRHIGNGEWERTTPHICRLLLFKSTTVMAKATGHSISNEEVDYVVACSIVICEWLSGLPGRRLPSYEYVNGHRLGSTIMYAVMDTFIRLLWPWIAMQHRSLFVFKSTRAAKLHQRLVKEYTELLLNEK